MKIRTGNCIKECDYGKQRPIPKQTQENREFSPNQEQKKRGKKNNNGRYVITHGETRSQVNNQRVLNRSKKRYATMNAISGANK